MASRAPANRQSTAEVRTQPQTNSQAPKALRSDPSKVPYCLKLPGMFLSAQTRSLRLPVEAEPVFGLRPLRGQARLLMASAQVTKANSELLSGRYLGTIYVGLSKSIYKNCVVQTHLLILLSLTILSGLQFGWLFLQPLDIWQQTVSCFYVYTASFMENLWNFCQLMCPVQYKDNNCWIGLKYILWLRQAA